MRRYLNDVRSGCGMGERGIPKSDKSTVKLRECDSDKGEMGQ